MAMAKATLIEEHHQHNHPPLECIDLASPHKLANAAQIRQACVSAGFFYIVNHGMDPSFVAEVFEQSKRFFALPVEEKMKVFRDKNQRGYSPFEEDMLNPGYQSRGETKEGYYIGLSIPDSDLPLYGPNQYPSTEVLPGWKESMDRYYQEVTKLAKRLAPLLALALNLDESYFDQKGILDQPTSTMRLLHYSGDLRYHNNDVFEASVPTEQSDIGGGVFGAGAHSDWGFFTLLVTDDVPGLQICRNKDAVPQVWEDVPPMNGAYIVNLGQLLERWSNGLFRATLHRVIGKGVDRYSVAMKDIVTVPLAYDSKGDTHISSIPFFFEPNYEWVVECLPTCCSQDNPLRYPPTRSGDHIVNLYKQTHKNAFLGLA